MHRVPERAVAWRRWQAWAGVAIGHPRVVVVAVTLLLIFPPVCPWLSDDRVLFPALTIYLFDVVADPALVAAVAAVALVPVVVVLVVLATPVAILLAKFGIAVD